MMPLLTELKIGILGGKGFLGGNLVEYFINHGADVSAVTRENYNKHREKFFDVLINANGNSKKFWANQHPREDYELSVASVEKSIRDFKFGLYVYVSSSDVYPDHHNPNQALESIKIDTSRLEPYGLHKYQAEQLVQRLPNFLILRLSALVGRGLKKGAIKDILGGAELFISLDSQLQFISTDEVGRVVELLIDQDIKNEIFNCGGQGSIKIFEAGSILEKTVKARPDAQVQRYEMGVQKLSSLVNLKTSKAYLMEFNRTYAPPPFRTGGAGS